MRLEPLYRATFRYPDGGRGTTLEGDAGSEGHYFFVAEGSTEGRVTGRLQAANHPRSRVDRTALPDIQGAIETDDGATVVFSWQGFARPYPPERRQIVVAGTHVCGDERYAWLNDVVCVGTGEIRPRDSAGGPRAVVGGSIDFVIDFAALIWEPIP
jgi:Protein of unknown function (DUF3237)